MRREYMYNLAFIYDREKGEDTFNAFSVTGADKVYVFYLAS